MLLDCLLDTSVHREKSLLGTPVELLDVVTTEGVDHSSNGRSLTTAGVIKVEHTLDSTGLETEDEGAGSIVKRPEPGPGRGLVGSVEVDDLVVGLSALAVRANGTNGAVLGGGDLSSSGLGGSRDGGGRRDRVDSVLRLCLDTKSKRNDLSNVSVGTVNLDGYTEGLSQETHGLETLLVVGTTTTDVDADIVSDEAAAVLLEGADDALEGRSDIGEVGNATTDDEDFALETAVRLGRLSARNEVEDSLRVFVGLRFGRSAGVFTVVGKLVGEAVSRDGIGVDNGGTATCI